MIADQGTDVQDSCLVGMVVLFHIFHSLSNNAQRFDKLNAAQAMELVREEQTGKHILKSIYIQNLKLYFHLVNILFSPVGFKGNRFHYWNYS